MYLQYYVREEQHVKNTVVRFGKVKLPFVVLGHSEMKMRSAAGGFLFIKNKRN